MGSRSWSDPQTRRALRQQLAAPVEVTDDMRIGVVCLPCGWGHDAPRARLRVAEGRPGVNTNILTNGGGDAYDPVSGNAVLNRIPVTVTSGD